MSWSVGPWCTGATPPMVPATDGRLVRPPAPAASSDDTGPDVGSSRDDRAGPDLRPGRPRCRVAADSGAPRGLATRGSAAGDRRAGPRGAPGPRRRRPSVVLVRGGRRPGPGLAAATVVHDGRLARAGVGDVVERRRLQPRSGS